MALIGLLPIYLDREEGEALAEALPALLYSIFRIPLRRLSGLVKDG